MTKVLSTEQEDQYVGFFVVLTTGLDVAPVEPSGLLNLDHCGSSERFSCILMLILTLFATLNILALFLHCEYYHVESMTSYIVISVFLEIQHVNCMYVLSFSVFVDAL